MRPAWFVSLIGVTCVAACSAGSEGGSGTGGNGAVAAAGGNAASAGTAGSSGAGAGGSGAVGGGDASVGGGGTGGAGVSDAGFPDVNFYYDAPVITPEACASTVVEGKLTPIGLYFMLDTSGSMGGSNITALKTGVTSFAGGATAAGIFVTGQRFPIGGFNETCASSAYASPAVPWGVLPYPSFNAWVNGLTATGYTPSIPGLQGAVDACKARIAAQPTHKCVVVFVTDGNPEGNCPPTGSAAQTPLGNIAAGALAAGIPVFAIGFPGLPALGQGIINHVASQGGTGSAFIITGGNIGQQFTTQLQAIQSKTLGCEYVMPTTTQGTIDPNKVQVEFTSGGGNPQTIGRVANAAACGPNGGWYYDNPANPKLIKLCPTTCTAVQADSKGKVEINLGCLGS
jgi:hypothetical protein